MTLVLRGDGRGEKNDLHRNDYFACYCMHGVGEMRKIRKKVLFYKGLLAEILETLCSICLWLNADRMGRYNPHSIHMHGHFNNLKQAADILREEMAEERKKK